MKAYAIRQVGSNLYMPAHISRRSKFTKDDPVENGGISGPRLLPNKKSASLVIANWKRGITSLQIVRHDYELSLFIESIKAREDIKLEIVEFELVPTFVTYPK